MDAATLDTRKRDGKREGITAERKTRKGSSLLGFLVIGQKDGAHVGNVQDLIFDHDADEVLAIVVSAQDLFGLIDAKIVPWHQVRLVGRDVVLVEGADSKIHVRDEPRIQQLLDRKTLLSGTQILTADGRSLGTLGDTFIDITTGRIVGYEVSGGLVEDTLRGKKFLPAQDDKHVGKDAIVVPPTAADELQRKNGK